jgi:hypothetical protein
LIGPGFQGCMPDPATMQARQPILAAGRGLSLQALAHAGATLTGRLVAVDDRRVIFDDSARANIAAGDAFAARVAGMITHSGCAAAVPGVWYVGLRWLTHRGSATLDGFPTDTATVADAVRAQLNGSDRTLPTTRGSQAAEAG